MGLTQVSSNDAAALEFLQPRQLDLAALQRPTPKGSAEAAAQARPPASHVMFTNSSTLFECCIALTTTSF